MTREVLLLGGGYVGVWAARRLARSGADVRVTLVSAAPCHSFHGWTAEVITGEVAAEHARVPLTALLPGVRLVRGQVTRIDAAARTVAVRTDGSERLLSYDQLVVGVGSHDAVDRVPGLAEHGWTIKGDGALAELTAHLTEVVDAAAGSADPDERSSLLTAVVAGGGYAGTEAAAAISLRLRNAVAARPVLEDVRPRVVLLTSGAHLVPSLRPRFARVADYLEREAERAGVEIRRDSRLAAVEAGGARLADAGDIAAATVVSTIGQTPTAVPGTETWSRDAAGRLVTDRFLAVAPGIWAGGDVAAVPHPSGTGSCPANALWAIYHGKHIGRNLARVLEGRGPTPFRFPGLGQAASIGVGRGAAELYGIPLTGWPAWLARWGFFHWFMPSRRVALAAAAGWFRRSRQGGSGMAGSSACRSTPPLPTASAATAPAWSAPSSRTTTTTASSWSDGWTTRRSTGR
jgi:NADH dehydrogenase